jgi:hypothetical protein
MAASATIQRYVMSDAGYAEYVVQVFYHGKQWVIRKRYSDFDQFDRKIREDGYDISQSLPPKVCLV